MSPVFGWNMLACLALVPAVGAFLALPLLPPAWQAGAALGAAVAIPVTAAAALVSGVALRQAAVVALIGVVAALVVRFAGLALTAIMLHLLAPALLPPALVTLGALLLLALVGESLLCVRRLSADPAGSPRV